MSNESEKNTVKARNKDGTFAKGNQLGNRKGRPPKEISIPDILREIGDQEIANSSGERSTKLRALMNIVYNNALQGERWAVDFIANRTEGTPVQTVRTQEIAKDEIVEI